MRKILVGAAVLALVAGVVLAGQLSTTWTLRNVVDPPDLRDGLNADAQAADARLDALETYSNATASVTYSNMTLNGACTINEGALANSTVVSADIKDGEIVNADVNASAAIAWSKISGTGTLAVTNTASITMDGTACVTTNQTFLSSTGVTNTLVIVDGLIKAIE